MENQYNIQLMVIVYLYFLMLYTKWLFLSDPKLLTQFKVRVLEVLYAAGFVVRKVKVESGASSVSCLEERSVVSSSWPGSHLPFFVSFL